MRRAPAVTLVLLLLAATAVGPATAAAVPADDGVAVTSPSDATDHTTREGSTAPAPDGVVHHELTRADPGRVRVALEVGVTTATTAFRVTLPAAVEVTGTDGFDRAEGTTYEWDGRTAAPGLTYRAPVNRTVGNSVRFAATDDWALVDMTDVDTAFSWRSRGGTSYERRFAVPNGYAGAAMAYLGDYRVANASAAGQRFTVVHPTVVGTPVEPATYAGTLAGVAEGLSVGARDPAVTAFIAPPPVGANGGEGGVGGLATGADLWVAADEATRSDADGVRVNEPIFVHEYVHTRQNYTLAADTTWFTEASAFYYMSLAPYQRGTIPRERFGERFRVAESFRDATLTGTTDAQYRVRATKGPRTLAALDRRIRASTNGSRTPQDVFRRMNEAEGNVTYAVFRSMVAATAGESHDAWLDRHVAGAELAQGPVPDAYPAPGTTAGPAAAEWRRGDEWVPLATTPLPAGIPVAVRHPEVGVVVRPAGATTAVSGPGGDPATVRLPAGEATLRVETFYGRNGTTVMVPTSDDVDGDGVTNADESAQGSDPYDADSSTATPESGRLDGGGNGTEGAAFEDGPGFGVTGALVAGAVLVGWLVVRRRHG